MSYIEYFPAPDSNYTYVQLMQHVNNDLTNSTFGGMILLAIFSISFIAMKNFPMEKAFTAAAWLTAICSYMLAILGLIAAPIIVMTTLLAVVGIFFLWRGG